MARNNLTWIKGDITGDIYYDIFHLEAKDVQYLRLYLMVKGVAGAAPLLPALALPGCDADNGSLPATRFSTRPIALHRWISA